ncbi:MAG: hypothetical protein CMH54_00125 [Myxococcales bacterium]|nr:hypothetical protein [Myxococcales bacterium]
MVEIFFKKYFWVVTVVTTIVVALLSALTVNAIVAGKLNGLIPGTVTVPSSKSVKSSTLTKRWYNEEGLGRELGEERMFNADPPPSVLAALESDSTNSSGEMDSGEGTGEGEDEEAIPLSDLNVELIGTLVAEDTEWSLATIKKGGSAKLVRIGTELEPGITVSAIERTYMLVKRGDKEERIRLWGEKKKGGIASRNSRRYPPRPGAGRGRKTSRRKAKSRDSRRRTSNKVNWSKGVKKVGPWEYRLDRSMLDEELEDMAGLSSGAKIVPNMRGGKYQGFRLAAVRPNSIYKAIGLQTGDQLKRINGDDIDSPTKALQLFEKLRSANSIAIDVIRGGAPRTINYTIH